MQATAESRASGRHGPGNGPGLRAHGPGANGTGRVPPNDQAAERSLIGAMLNAYAGTTAVETAMAALVPEDFYDHGHRNIVTAIFALAVKGTTVDAVTVAAQLRLDGVWVDEMGSDFIAMINEVPAIGNVGEYATIVRGCARRRQMRSVAAAIEDAAQAGDEVALERALASAHDVHAGGRPELVVEDLGAVIRGEEPEIVPTMLFRADGKALIYPGLLHWVMGEPGCGKTWMALVAELAAVQSGMTGVYLDYEGSRRIVGARLGHLGASEHDADRIAYVRPQGGSSTTGPGALRLVREWGASIVVIDGAAKAMAREGLDEDRASDVLGFLERMVWPLCEAGAAVVILDHVPKDKDSRGRWARGSGAKLGEVDGAAYSVRVGKAWSRTQAGYAAIDVAKDREGVVGAVGDTAALLKFAPGAVGGLRVWLEVPDEDEGQSTGSIHDAILRVLDDTRAEMSTARLENEVRQHGKWSNYIIRAAAERLADDGRVRLRFGPRNAHLYSSLNVPVEDPQLHIVPPVEEDS